ncbi:hypothetical protein [Acaryochloris sp. CCMEE 5410]|uniref:hypothetical protein n=1 Tax=Acaryochloris sp. CCMEE 5410 TaxID=310037 RepID=UPI0021CE7EF6|nr:hypothetical protein [Acaryochloris sp. CCMEE 5410]
MKRRLFSALLAALPTLTQIAPAIAQTTTAAAAPLDPNTEVSLPGLYYDPDAPHPPLASSLVQSKRGMWMCLLCLLV